MTVFIRLLFVVLLLLSATTTHAVVVDTSAGIYSVKTKEGRYSNLSNTLRNQVWWNDDQLAYEFADAVGDQFGPLNSASHFGIPGYFGPVFAVQSQTAYANFSAFGTSALHYNSNPSFHYAVASRITRQEANVLSAWSNAFNWGQTNTGATSSESYRERKAREYACPNDPTCDIDAIVAENSAIVVEGSELLIEAGRTTGELAIDAVPIPTSKTETVLAIIKFGLDGILNYFYDDEEGANIIGSEITGTEAEFSINPDFYLFDGVLELTLEDTFFDDQILGEKWLNGYQSISGYEEFLGVYEITGVGINSLSISFLQLESTSASVPVPTSIALFGLGLAGLCFARHKNA